MQKLPFAVTPTGRDGSGRGAVKTSCHFEVRIPPMDAYSDIGLLDFPIDQIMAHGS